jgi:hypothetical protein
MLPSRLKPLSRKTTKRQRKTNAVVLSGLMGHVLLGAAPIRHAVEIRSIMSSQQTPGSIEATAPVASNPQSSPLIPSAVATELHVADAEE